MIGNRLIGRILFGVCGLILLLFSLIWVFFFHRYGWYAPFTVGLTAFLGFLNDSKGQFSFYHWLSHDRRQLISSYIYYLAAGILIELLGRGLLGLWVFAPMPDWFLVVYVFLIGYPFALFATFETYLLFSQFLKRWPAVAVTTVFSAFLHEIPNTWVFSWSYLIPYVSSTIFQINVVVILGWTILVLVAMKKEVWRLIF